MLAYLFYTKGTPGERQMDNFADELRHNQVDVELVEADTPHGIQLSDDYDVLARPAVVLAGPDGTPVQRWQDEIPTASDVSYWAHH